MPGGVEGDADRVMEVSKLGVAVEGEKRTDTPGGRLAADRDTGWGVPETVQADTEVETDFP